jgi:hypothetical protein
MILVMIYYPAGFSGIYDWAKARVRTLFSNKESQQAEA